MSFSDLDIPEKDSPEYEAYLARKIEEEESRLKYLKDKCRVAPIEEELSHLRLQSARFKTPSRHDSSLDRLGRQETG